ncbi:MAG: carboxypeptidase regulatory-like domain-containing protein, partial [Gemmatimonadota bacterium]
CHSNGGIHGELVSPSRMGRSCWHLLTLALLLAATTPGISAAQQDTTFLEAVVEVRVASGPSAVLLAMVHDSTMLLSADQFFNLVELGVTGVRPNESYEVVQEPEGIRIEFSSAAGTVSRERSVFRIPPAHATWSAGSFYISTDVLAAALAISLEVDWADLIVVVRNSDDLPVVHRLERERRRGVALGEPVPTLPVYDARLRSNVAAGAVLDWALTSSTRDPFNASGVDLGLGVQLLGGSLDVRHTERTTTVGRVHSTLASWNKAWPQHRWLRQLAVGDVASTGWRRRLVRGVAVTNAPFLRPSNFADQWLVGSFPAGWEVELYYNRRLVGFTVVDETDMYRFHVPVRYGQNPLDVIAYGPNGQLVRTRRTFVIPNDRLPARQFEYGVSVGECKVDLCKGSFNVDAWYGISSTLSVRAGSDFFLRDSLPDLWHPYGIVAFAPARSLSLTVQAVHDGFVNGRLSFTPTPDLELHLDHTEFTSDAEDPIVASPTLERRFRGLLFWRPGKEDRAPFLRMTAQRSETASGTFDVARLAATALIGGGRLEIGVQHLAVGLEGQPNQVSRVIDARGSVVLRGPTPLLRHTFVQGGIGVDPDSGVSSVTAGIARNLVRQLRLDVEVGWRRGLSGFNALIGITATLPSLRAVSRNVYSEATGVQGQQLLEGSILWDHQNKHVRFADGRSLGRAGVSGEVFVDANGNGVRDTNEEGFPDLRLNLGSRGVTTDSLGRFSTWDFVPFESLILEIDSLSIDTPLWVPATPLMSLSPGPNSFSYMQIPLVQAGEVSGTAVFGDGDLPAGGLHLILEDPQSGLTIPTRTFSDGAFFFMGLRPGRYQVRVDDAQLRQLRMSSTPIEVIVDPSAGQVVMEGIVIRLEREP